MLSHATINILILQRIKGGRGLKKAIGVLVAVLMVINFIVFDVAIASTLTPSARAAILMDVVSGRILYAKDEKEKLPMASTTKIVTAITAIESGNLQDIVTASMKAQNTGGSSIYLQAGERLSLEDLLYGLMLQSGNDAAVAIAEHVGGSVNGFARMMNEKAAEIGAFNSNFVNPHGLDTHNHYTTAEDLGRIAAYALRNDVFSKIVSTKQKRIPWWGRDYCRVLKNKNKLLWSVKGGDGVKTGYTRNAGRCLVSSATRDGWQLVAVVLNCGSMWEESTNLLEYGFSAYQPVTYYEKGQFVKTIAVFNGKKDRVRIVTDRLVRVPLTQEEKERVEIVENWPDYLEAPVKEGQVAGQVRIELDGKVLIKANLVCQESVKEKDLKKFLFDIIANTIKKAI
jgi:D-alanyl-D-alanine carboxypeptidase (penicillin-binding protein 5/6)